MSRCSGFISTYPKRPSEVLCTWLHELPVQLQCKVSMLDALMPRSSWEMARGDPNGLTVSKQYHGPMDVATGCNTSIEST